jgi:hypothetical protein
LAQNLLCGWFLYLTILSALTALSAGPRSKLGLLAWAAAGCGLFLLLTLFGTLDVPRLGMLELAAKVYILAAGALVLLVSRREDTRLIALLLTGAAVFPLVLYFYH